ncbi:hypothetical protein BT63DRAFT_450512 [Microthyrium microscopicum]|uniref:37S ribosomal protein mrp10, mitochondrial n=1 Tax=Microthyrium microscopicum TaxID=703497 RepID=A0A6A6UTE6_9PEZI|nr:hypothetical protein BT63DRAFT_450512 [Microthyrium microscopicum]
MVPKPVTGAVRKASIQKLAVDKLVVKNSSVREQNPCTTVMTAMLGCWASQGQVAANCLALEQSLRTCMDTKGIQKTRKNPINQQLSQFYKSFRGPKPSKNH